MNSILNQRPLVSHVSAEYQMEFAAYLQSRRNNWMSAEQWMAWKMANKGNAVKVGKVSPGTVRTDAQPKPVVQREVVHTSQTVPKNVIDLGHRFVGSNSPRLGVPLPDEILHEKTGEPMSKGTTKREDF